MNNPSWFYGGIGNGHLTAWFKHTAVYIICECGHEFSIPYNPPMKISCYKCKKQSGFINITSTTEHPISVSFA